MPVIFDIKRFALHDGPGIRTTVFMKGCPLNCLWCHNPESHSSETEMYTVKKKLDGKEIALARIYGKKVGHEDLIHELLSDRIFYSVSGGGVTFSGGEPLSQHKDLTKMLKTLGEYSIHRAVDTSGYSSSEILLGVAEHTDLFLYDLKIMDPVLHKKYTGVDNKIILKNAEILLNKEAEIIFRLPLIPGINDTEKEINAFIDYFSQRRSIVKKVHLLPYHKIGSDKYRRMKKEYLLRKLVEHSSDRIDEIKMQIETSGVKVEIGG